MKLFFGLFKQIPAYKSHFESFFVSRGSFCSHLQEKCGMVGVNVWMWGRLTGSCLHHR